MANVRVVARSEFPLRRRAPPSPLSHPAVVSLSTKLVNIAHMIPILVPPHSPVQVERREASSLLSLLRPVCRRLVGVMLWLVRRRVKQVPFACECFQCAMPSYWPLVFIAVPLRHILWPDGFLTSVCAFSLASSCASAIALHTSTAAVLRQNCLRSANMRHVRP